MITPDHRDHKPIGLSAWKLRSDNCMQLKKPPPVLSKMVTCSCVRNPRGRLNRARVFQKRDQILSRPQNNGPVVGFSLPKMHMIYTSKLLTFKFTAYTIQVVIHPLQLTSSCSVEEPLHNNPWPCTAVMQPALWYER